MLMVGATDRTDNNRVVKRKLFVSAESVSMMYIICIELVEMENVSFEMKLGLKFC